MILRSIKYTIVFLILTLLTQIGGIIFLISAILYKPLAKHNSRLNFIGAKALFFIALYFLSTFLLIPHVAKYFGRVPLPIYSKTGSLKPLSPVTYLLNRHYVTIELKNTLIKISSTFNKKYNNTIIHYLDANFPFINGFPLFPHLSHNDGRKVDLTFLYVDTLQNMPSNDVPSYFGYGTYVAPKGNEVNTTIECEKRGYWQYGLLGKILPKKHNANLILDETRTRDLLLLLSKEQAINKIFIEPHLKSRLNLDKVHKIRFHGCHAVRHDDHIHIQQ